MIFDGSSRPARLIGLCGLGFERGLQRRETSARPHHADRERAGAPTAGGNGVALSTTPSVCVASTAAKANHAGVIAIADKAQQRLCRRFSRLMEQHNPAPKVVVTLARQLAGFLCAAFQPAPPVPAR
jgi:hypothetical protein